MVHIREYDGIREISIFLRLTFLYCTIASFYHPPAPPPPPPPLSTDNVFVVVQDTKTGGALTRTHKGMFTLYTNTDTGLLNDERLKVKVSGAHRFGPSRSRPRIRRGVVRNARSHYARESAESDHRRQHHHHHYGETDHRNPH